MSVCAELRVLFRAPAGPRRGYGHLLRCRSLARAIGVRPLLNLREPAQVVDVALRFGCDVVHGSPHRLLRSLRLDVLVVDDPDPRAAARWIAAARRVGVAVASVHDLGIGCYDADLLIDGSVIRRIDGVKDRALTGPSFAIVDPRLPRLAGSTRSRRGVVVSLGGGPRADVACAIAEEIARRAPDVPVRVVGGFVSSGPSRGRLQRSPSVTWIGASTSLAEELRRAQVAIVGGGVSLYEACAVGTPAVGVPVVDAQRPTVAGFVARGAALGRARGAIVPRRVAHDALSLLRERPLRARVARAARRLIDGRGALRAARAIARLAEGR